MPSKIMIKIKLAMTVSAIWAINIKAQILPSHDLLAIMGMFIILDFVTGIIKAVILGIARTSTGYRRTIIKFMQYGGALLIGMAIKYMSVTYKDFGDTGKYADWLTSGLLIFIIFIEITSVLENVYAVDKTTPFSKYVISPLLRLLTFQITNNPINKAADETEKINQ